jgi:hypothetical protein
LCLTSPTVDNPFASEGISYHAEVCEKDYLRTMQTDQSSKQWSHRVAKGP